MYTYLASATGLTAAFPPSLQDGGFDSLWQRLQRARCPGKNEESNEYKCTGLGKYILWSRRCKGSFVVGFKQRFASKYIGKTLEEVAKIRGTSPEETAMNLIVEDSTRIGVSYFSMDSVNVKKEVALPWMSFCSDAASEAPEGVFLKSNPHPRAYGSFIRVLGKYSRDEKIIPLQEAIRQLSKFLRQI